MSLNISFILLTGFFISLFVNLIILRYFSFNIADKFLGPQKIHKLSIPRVGGLAIFCSLFYQSLMFIELYNELIFVVLCCLPVFFFGILEDFTNKVSPSIRLIASFFSALLLVFILEIKINTFKIPFLEFVFYYSLISLVISVLSIAMLGHAVNLIDGLNGLSQLSSLISLTSITVLSYQMGDDILFVLSMTMIVSILGLIFFNFPYGRIFLGDGGAYLLGTYIASLVIMLSMRNNDISPFASLLIVFFPIYELLRTILRRSISDYKTLILPDSKHLHSMIYKYMVLKHKSESLKINSTSSLLCLILPLITCSLAVLFYNNLTVLLLVIFTYILIIEGIMKFLNNLKYD